MRMREAPQSSAAVMKSSSRSARKRPRTTRASSVQPISEMMMVMAKYTRCGDQLVGTAAARPIHSGMVGIERRISMMRWITVSTQPPCRPEMPPSRHAEQQAERHAHQPDGERGAGGEDQAGEHVAPKLVGAEQEERILRLAVGDAQQMDVGREQAEQVVRIAVREQHQVARIGRVRGVGQLERAQIALALQRDRRADGNAVGVEPVDRLRRDVAARGLGIERLRNRRCKSANTATR